MKNIALIFCVLMIATCPTNGQTFNTTLLDNWNTGNSTFYNDIWGYEAPDGTEYVIAGSSSNIHFLKIENDNKLTEVTSASPGSSSTWRDIKTYGNYAYGVADRGSLEGLSIYDLSTLPTEATFVKQVKTEFLRAHNIYIDEANARLYAIGFSGSPLSVVIYDLSNPTDPDTLSTLNLSAGYIHDMYVKDNIGYASHGGNGYVVYDFTDPINPITIGTINTTLGYNHSSWVTPDGNTAFYAEETTGRPITVLDISDPQNFDIVATIKDPLLAPTHMNNIGHNPFLKNGFLYVSYYQDGLQVWDVRDLTNINRVAYYDTSPLNTTYSGTTRNWGAYPFLKDNKVAISDTQNGVYLVQISSAALPLEFIDFKLAIKNKSTQISWRTSGEYNVSHFEIQRSLDGENFETIGRHDPTNQNAGIKTYTFTDRSPHRGINYYKIKSIDLDGKTNATRIRSVRINYRSDINIFPNPSNGQFYLSDVIQSDNEIYYAQIKDMSGRIILKKALPNINSSDLLFDLNLPPGNYLIDLYQNQILTWSDQLILID